MPACGCIQICNCKVSEDGVLGLQVGRNFTTVVGSGSVEDPFVISFLDQDEFKPKSAEINYSNTTAQEGDWRNVTDQGGVITYETPVPFILPFPYPRYAQANFFLIGASVTFAEGSFATSDGRTMVLAVGKNPPPGLRVIAGQTSSAAGGDPITLSCEGFTPGIFTIVPGLSTVVQQFEVYVIAESFGSPPLPVSNIKVWMTQI